MTLPYPAFRRGILYVALTAVVTAALGCGSKDEVPEKKMEESKVPAIVFLGDSLVAGYRLMPEEAFPARIQKKIEAEKLPYRVVNAGRSGDTTAGGLSRLDWILRREVHLKVLVIELGSNDAMRGTSLAVTEENIRQIIRKTRAFDPNVKILLMELHTFPNMGPEYAKGFTAIYPRISRTENVPLLPFLLMGVAGKPDLNQDDAIHPNSKGSVIVAENVWKALRPHL